MPHEAVRTAGGFEHRQEHMRKHTTIAAAAAGLALAVGAPLVSATVANAARPRP